MAESVQWGDISNASGSNNEYLKLVSGNTYRIRPIFNPVKFYKYFHKKDGKLRTALCANPDTCSVRENHPELKKPALRYAVYVIDRDDNKVKIMEAPQTVFFPLRDRFEATKKDPGAGKDGSDWQIKVEGRGLQTKYSSIYLDQSPLTNEEKQRIAEVLDGDKEKLEKLYAVDSPEKIEEKLFGELQDDNSGSAVASGDTSENSDESDPFNFG